MSSKKYIGKEISKPIKAYVYQYQKQINHQDSLREKKTNLEHNPYKHNNMQHRNLNSNKIMAHQERENNRTKDSINRQEQSRATQGERNKLLELLHNSIAQHQVYPEAAFELGQTGKVMISFEMSPSGQMIQIKIIKSSGSQVLDAAAIQTLEKISPFSAAQQYLNKTEKFSVSIIYN